MKRIFRIPYWGLLAGPWLIFYLGAGLNQLVMAVNGGAMPVLFPGVLDLSSDPIHIAMTHATHLKFLADWIDLHTAILSPGDLLLLLAEAIQSPCFYAWLAIVLVYLIGE